MFDFQMVFTIILAVFAFTFIVMMTAFVLARMAKRAIQRGFKRVFFAPLPKFKNTRRTA
jgi:hypothetical protein